MNKSRSKTRWRELKYIVFRNLFLLTNGILFVVAILLIVFGSIAGWFFLLIITLNIALGLIQDIYSWLSLQKLQLLTAPRANRVRKDATVEVIPTEDIQRGDILLLKVGDPVPCDGSLIETNSFEINEGLITGESTSLPRANGDKVLAGSIVTSGSGTMRVHGLPEESRIARMTEGIKKYSVTISPIQKSVRNIVQYSIIALIAGIVIVIFRGIANGSTPLSMINIIGSITSVFVPQGLVFAVTLFFAYGALHLFQRQVLVQEVSATEKLGRIENLCMDKTGTLTQNELTVEHIYTPAHITKEEAELFTAAYIDGTRDSSQIIQAIKRYLNKPYEGEIFETLAFSSWRKYGAIRIASKYGECVVFVGLPNAFMHLLCESDRQWIKELSGSRGAEGKRLLGIFKSKTKIIPHDLSKHQAVTLVAIFVIHNPLREGIKDTVDFFQKRDIRIHIISGDNPETVQSVAQAAGIKDYNRIITGRELESWQQSDFDAEVNSYSIFAGILPEQKAKIITAFKKRGFTAMIGDGANDALAIKTADLGIAMFDGAPATREVASIVLMNSSFVALPGGVELAELVIRNVEIFSSLFLNQVFMGFLLFVALSAFGREYPLAPLNITIINYFSIGMPGLLLSYWTLRPSGKIHRDISHSFTQRVLPFAAISAILQTSGLLLVYALSPTYLQNAPSNTLIVIFFIIFGLLFFAFTPAVYRESLSRSQKIQFIALGIIELILIPLVFRMNIVISFFTLTVVDISRGLSAELALIILLFGAAQYGIARWIRKSL